MACFNFSLHDMVGADQQNQQVVKKFQEHLLVIGFLHTFLF